MTQNRAHERQRAHSTHISWLESVKMEHVGSKVLSAFVTRDLGQCLDPGHEVTWLFLKLGKKRWSCVTHYLTGEGQNGRYCCIFCIPPQENDT